MKERPYQLDAINAVLASFAEHQSVLIVLPTGSGKSIIFAHLCNRMLERGRCLVLAHREELISQAASKIRAVTGIDPDIEMADRYANEHGHFRGPSPIVVSSIQTQNSGRKQKRMRRFDPSEFSLLVIDEAHHAPAKTYRNVVGYYEQNPNLRVLGVTATPDRTDELALGQVFKDCPFIYGIEDAISDGWLVGIEQQYVVCGNLDFSSIHTTAGDLNQGELATVVEEERSLHEMVGPTIKIVGSRKTLFFATSVLQAERTAEIFNRHRDGMARCVFGHTPKDERKATISDYARGRFQVLVNVGVATEGFDDPAIEVVAVGRPTKSRALYCQMVGRSTRPLGGLVDCFDTAELRRNAILASSKPKALILDFVGNSGQHKLVSVADVLGGKFVDDDVQAAKELAEHNGKPMDMTKALEEARQDRLMRQLSEASRRAKIRADAEFKARQIDPFGRGDHAPAVVTPKWYWKHTSATEKQKSLLRKRGHETEGLTMAEASELIDEIARRENWRRRTG